MPARRRIAHLVGVTPSRACPLSLATRRPRTRSAGASRDRAAFPRPSRNADSGDDVARVLRVENRPDEQMRPDLAPSLLVVGRVGQVDDELRGADRARGEARAREVLAELAEELGVPDLDRDGPQFARSIGRASCVRKPCLRLFLLATPGRGRPRDLPVSSHSTSRTTPIQNSTPMTTATARKNPANAAGVVPPALGLRLPVDVLARGGAVSPPARRGIVGRMGRLRYLILFWLARQAWSIWQRRRRSRSSRSAT
jgi:hypothetical protein